MAKCARPNCLNKQHSGYGGYCQKHGLALGTVRTKVPAEPSRRIIRNLLDQGWSYYEIAQSADLPRGTVRNVIERGYPTVRQATHDALHNITPRLEKVPSWRAARRIQALRAAGFTILELAAGMGTSRSVIASLSTENYDTTTIDLFERVDKFYREHEMTPPRPAAPGTAKHGWITPIEWDDIDDPTERHDYLTYEETRDQAPITPEHVDAVRYLLSFGGLERVGDALGTSPNPVVKIRDGRGTAAREILRRVLHLAERRGWAPNTVAMAA